MTELGADVRPEEVREWLKTTGLTVSQVTDLWILRVDKYMCAILFELYIRGLRAMPRYMFNKFTEIVR